MAEYSDFLEQAEEIAEEAADLTLNYFRKAILIETKEDRSPVTVADRKSEEFIRERIKEAFPGHGILGEEFGRENESSDFLWTIDPIDGTRSFIRGIPLFGTLLGLIHRQQPVLGVMVLPVLEETYVAAKGHGAYCNGKKVHVSTTQNLGSALVGVGDYMAFEDAGKKKYYQKLLNEVDIVRSYTDCFGHSLLLRGSIDAMIDPVVAPWDVVPIACLVKEAGGEVFGFDGEASYHGKTSSFISCAPGLRDQLIAL